MDQVDVPESFFLRFKCCLGPIPKYSLRLEATSRSAVTVPGERIFITMLYQTRYLKNRLSNLPLKVPSHMKMASKFTSVSIGS